MPDPATKQRFFIALLPPQAIQDYANQVKQIFADRYDSRAAFKSPPHITLQAPFEWLADEMEILARSLSEFALQQAPVPITLFGFGAFVPRVIFINVVKTPELLALQAALMTDVEAKLGIVDPIGKSRPFAPHLTVGFRDLTKPNFRLAWTEFQHQPVQFEFTADHLTLLIHDGQRWTVCNQFPLQR